MHDPDTRLTHSALPDPELHPDFYVDVPAKRLVAWVVDTVLTTLITVAIIPLTAFTALFFLPVLFLTVNFLYRAVGLARHGATPGMRLMAIGLHDLRGGRPDPALAMVHTGLYILSLAFVLPQLISIVTILTSARGQSLVDMVLGTAMLNRAARA